MNVVVNLLNSLWHGLLWPSGALDRVTGTLILLPLLPALAFVLAGLCLRRRPKVAAGLVIAVTAWAFVSSVRLLLAVGPLTSEVLTSVPWVSVGRVTLSVGFALNRLSALMLVVVSAVSLLVQVYSTAYMAGDPGYGRYFAYLSLFAAAMLGLVLAPNLFQMYVFYELVGLASFLLIGFWYEERGPIEASRKAFVTTRLGDFGLLLGILLLYWHSGTLDFTELARRAPSFSPAVLAPAALLIFSGAVGKSAQFPLHVWLPDAMAGPTPVSALIHAATMVAAGVYLVARAYPLFVPAVAGPLPLAIVAGIGALTALLGATAAVAQSDFKRVLAYSTISQLGLMMLGLGAEGRMAAVFHLLTHAFFKALLFLGAGAVIFRYHHEQDIWRMGGLAGPMPVTAAAFGVGALALAGIPPFAGFFSKDAILHAVLIRAEHSLLYAIYLVVGLLTSLLTAFYAGRLFFLVFTGERHAAEERPDHHQTHGHDTVTEAPPVMTVPLVVLALPAVALGYFGQLALTAGGERLNLGLAGSTALLALVGLGAAWYLYGRRRPAADPLIPVLGPVYGFLRSGYRLDDLYTGLGDVFVRGLAAVLRWFDRTVVDGLVDAVAFVLGLSGRTLRLFQNGWVQRYVLWMAAAVFLALLLWLGRGFGPYGLGGLR